MLRQQNSKRQGNVGVGIAVGWFVAQGYVVSIPLTDSQDYDLVVEMNGQLRRVQVKTTRCRSTSGEFAVELRTKGGNRSGTGKTKYLNERGADLLFVLAEDGRKYLIPIEQCPRSRMVLGSVWDEYRIKP